MEKSHDTSEILKIKVLKILSLPYLVLKGGIVVQFIVQIAINVFDTLDRIIAKGQIDEVISNAVGNWAIGWLRLKGGANV